MKYEQEARERQGIKDKIDELETMLQDIQSDFAECARGVSPCFFCENDDACSCVNDNGCYFKWKQHN
jgi:hypothetical protein